MSKNYNSNLQTNNTNLQAILDTVNSLPENTGGQATPVITVDTNGLITATAGTKSVTKQLTTQAATTITPSTLDQIAINSGVYATGNITIKGDSNLKAENIVSGKSIFGVNGIASSGDTSVEDDIITCNITNYYNDRVDNIGKWAFAYCNNLTTVSFPACISIYSSAFFGCFNLTTVSFPVCKTIHQFAFTSCTKLTSANFPSCIVIQYKAFTDCSKLTMANFPSCMYIEEYAFAYCYSLTTINFPSCTHIYSYAFVNCSNLTKVNFPIAQLIDEYAFGYCSKLEAVKFAACSVISALTFRTCYRLSSLTLDGSSVCQLRGSNAFSSTPFAGYKSYFSGTPVIYVPSSQLTTYKTATNWTYFSQYMQAIPEDSGSSNATIINFTIEGKSYQAEEGMTWTQWVNSEYNVGGYRVEDGSIYVFSGQAATIALSTGLSASKVSKNDAIIENHEYYISATFS